ncbi:unnamed protein product [Ectocarpus sp. CCAP 1310/34]|nr:unnamed protein product [Ectocarpus sp. CCAP 1310/34]
MYALRFLTIFFVVSRAHIGDRINRKLVHSWLKEDRGF